MLLKITKFMDSNLRSGQIHVDVEFDTHGKLSLQETTDNKKGFTP